MMNFAKTDDGFMVSVKAEGDCVMKVFDWSCAVWICALSVGFLVNFLFLLG